jgi:hypothetical protein
MGFKGLNCITGAGRGETTTWRKERRDEILISPNQSDGNLLNQEANLHNTQENEAIPSILLHIRHPSHT